MEHLQKHIIIIIKPNTEGLTALLNNLHTHAKFKGSYTHIELYCSVFQGPFDDRDRGEALVLFSGPSVHAGPLHHRKCHLLPSLRWYQIQLFDDRDMHAQTTCPGSLRTIPSLGLNSQNKHPNGIDHFICIFVIFITPTCICTRLHKFTYTY